MIDRDDNNRRGRWSHPSDALLAACCRPLLPLNNLALSGRAGGVFEAVEQNEKPFQGSRPFRPNDLVHES
jgi:hypothetical protein